MTREELFAVLRPIVIDVTGVPECILADQNETDPTGEYCSIEPFDNIRKRGQAAQSWEEVDPVDGDTNYMDLQHSVTTHQIVRTSFNFYRGSARDYANLLQDADKFSSVNDTLRASNIGWMDTGAVNNLTALQSGRQEPRHQIYVTFWINRTQTETVQQIYNVPIQGEDENSNTVSDYTVSIE